jgi:hypothetical protein
MRAHDRVLFLLALLGGQSRVEQGRHRGGALIFLDGALRWA